MTSSACADAVDVNRKQVEHAAEAKTCRGASVAVTADFKRGRFICNRGSHLLQTQYNSPDLQHFQVRAFSHIYMAAPGDVNRWEHLLSNTLFIRFLLPLSYDHEGVANTSM